MEIKVTTENQTINAEELIERKIKPYGKGGAYVTIPVKHLGKKATVIINKNTKTKELTKTQKQKLIKKLEKELTKLEKITKPHGWVHATAIANEIATIQEKICELKK